MTLLRLTSSHVEVAALATHSTCDFILPSFLHVLPFCGCLRPPLGVHGHIMLVQALHFFLRNPRSLTNSTAEQNSKRTSSSLAICHPHCLTLCSPSTTSWVTRERRQDTLQKATPPANHPVTPHLPSYQDLSLSKLPTISWGLMRKPTRIMSLWNPHLFHLLTLNLNLKSEMEIRHKDLIFKKKKKTCEIWHQGQLYTLQNPVEYENIGSFYK